MSKCAPTLRHLNADTTWLLSIPTPDAEKGVFTLLIDPWLTGPQTDYWTHFSTQWHAIKSSIEHISEIGEKIDAVVVSHEFTDHMHRETLEEMDKDIPVYATTKAASIIRTWSHFAEVYDIPPLQPNTNWSTSCLNGLPSFIGISRIVSTSFDIAYLHSAICITYVPRLSSISFGNYKSLDSTSKTAGASAILYSPHGVPAPALTDLASHGITQVTALMHGLHEVWNPKILGGRLNLGAHNGLSSVQQCNARWWVGTHDEVKKERGLVSMVLKRKVWTVGEALERAGSAKDGTCVKFKALGSGESIVLE